MQLTTPVEIKNSKSLINHKSRIMLLGSCFAQNIGLRLEEGKHDLCANPFGIIYNPLSIATVLKRIVSGEPFTGESREIFNHLSKWHSVLHHGDFSRSTKEELLHTINHSLQQAHKYIKTADHIIITLGTAYVYERACDSLVVSNCHKLPANNFVRRLLSIEEASSAIDEAMKSIIAINKKIKFIITVSPIRHLRDGAHDNQKSKATLLLTADKLQKAHRERCEYFPAYEIMMDELRDYRFYAEDMTHPSPIAIEYIWEKFAGSHIDTKSIELHKAIKEIHKALAHRPFDAESKAYKDFLQSTAKKIEAIKEKHPYLNFEKEIEKCNTPSSK